MKNRILLIAGLFLLVSLQSYSQKFGFKLGANFTNQIWKDNNDTYSDDFKSALGGQLGFVAEIPINQSIFGQTGFSISQKGYKIDKDKLKWNTYLFYIDIPLNVLYKLDLKAVKIFAGGGLNVGIGAFGLQNWESTYFDPLQNKNVTVKDDDEVSWGSKDTCDYKRLDLGLNLTAGVEYGSMQFGVCYTPALSNISPVKDDGALMKNKLFTIFLAFVFGK